MITVLDRFRWIDGHADVWAVFRDPAAFGEIIAALADPFGGARITTVAGIESRGFLLGGAVAVALNVGFTAIRKSGSIFPGPKVRRVTSADYRGNDTELLMQRDALAPGDRVLMVDDWIETGSQAIAAQSMIAECGATLVGIAVVIDGLPDARRALLPPVHGLARQDSL
ncbi:phosphoribosyltransferase [Kibdelosporangium philippinense]|uniref:Phosphoribosyltransferase n=1 Tax=Kibdelosporangium philippinense TaxID=211113 RepID=A0ABS8ZBI0_9PSEU|nr:phosphoribosyltransferase family protein [Kibdelosporangium philippinense]MCE7005221.1 phosphoribosyltransferase [Kibdelosporangium philippinense]